MPHALNQRIAEEIGNYLWKVPIANAIASSSWGGTGGMMGSILSQLNTQNDNVKPSAFTAKSSGSATDDPSHWEELGKDTFKRVVKIETLKSKSTTLTDRPLNFGLRCNQFASVMVYLLRMNKNVDVPIEIVRMGASRSKCHYIVVLGRDKTVSGDTVISTNKETWGAQHILMDPWGAKQRDRFWQKKKDTGVCESRRNWFISPHEFDNQLHSICTWPAPSSRVLLDNVI